MKVVILAGGFGTRISEYTKTIPKPMIPINKIPILIHLINHYRKYNFNEFYIAVGYKSKVIKDYFKKKIKSCKINIVDTGLKTMTGGRLKRLNKYLGKKTFLMTYGDGLSNVNLKKLVKFHKQKKKIMTLTAVRPPARFGAIKITNNNKVKYFKEKIKVLMKVGLTGFFVIEPEIFKYIYNDKTYLERGPLERIADLGKLVAFKHNGFWQCMDTLRDKEILEKKIKKILS